MDENKDIPQTEERTEERTVQTLDEATVVFDKALDDSLGRFGEAIDAMKRFSPPVLDAIRQQLGYAPEAAVKAGVTITNVESDQAIFSVVLDAIDDGIRDVALARLAGSESTTSLIAKLPLLGFFCILGYGMAAKPGPTEKGNELHVERLVREVMHTAATALYNRKVGAGS